MLSDLLSTDNYVSFNTHVAAAFGLQSAVYITELINISSKAKQKKKLINGKFTIDRKYVEHRTTISVAMQRDIDRALAKIEVVDISSNDPDSLSFDLDVLFRIVADTEVKLLGDAKKLAKIKSRGSAADTKMSQRRAEIENLKSLAVHPNDELNAAYKDWVEGVYANPNGFLSKKSIEIFINRVDEYANRDLDVALKIVEIATVNGYRNADWAIETFKKDYESQFRRSYTTEQAPAVIEQKTELAEDVF